MSSIQFTTVYVSNFHCPSIAQVLCSSARSLWFLIISEQQYHRPRRHGPFRKPEKFVFMMNMCVLLAPIGRCTKLGTCFHPYASQRKPLRTLPPEREAISDIIASHTNQNRLLEYCSSGCNGMYSSANAVHI